MTRLIHGKAGTYYNRGCKCVACTIAANEHQQKFHNRYRAFLDNNQISHHPNIVHGTMRGRRLYSCHCTNCTEAYNKYNREWYRNKRSNS